jgi:signal peptidase I
MTDEPGRRRPADGDDIADSFEIDETARQYPSPRHRPVDPPQQPGSEQPGSQQPGSQQPGSQQPGSQQPGSQQPASDASSENRADAAANGATPPAAGDAPAPAPDTPGRSGRTVDPITGRPAGRRRSAGKRVSRKKKKPQRRKAPWWELPALIGLAIVIAVLVKSFLVQPFYIPSESMEKTLHGCSGCSGDKILVSKIVYDFRDPHPGDIVVFNAPNGWDDEPPSTPPSNPILRVVRGFGQLVGVVPPDGLVLVKRVIAVGGQSIKGDAAGHVYISNSGVHGPWRMLNETYVYETGPDPRAKFGPVTVPKGRLWVMGDHRDRSADSRYHCGDAGTDGPDNSSCNVRSATVPISEVIGKAFVIAWPPSRWTTLGTPKTFTDQAAGLAGTGVLPLGVVAPVFLVARRRRRRR